MTDALKERLAASVAGSKWWQWIWVLTSFLLFPLILAGVGFYRARKKKWPSAVRNGFALALLQHFVARLIVVLARE